MLRVELTVMTILGMAVLIPLTAAAKQPTGNCAVLVDDSVELGVPFTVTVRRVPALPGQWFSPTVTVEVVAPVIVTTPGPDSYRQTVMQTFNGVLTSNEATATFVIPALPNREVNGDVNVFATVSEPINRNLSRDSLCEAVTVFME